MADPVIPDVMVEAAQIEEHRIHCLWSHIAIGSEPHCYGCDVKAKAAVQAAYAAAVEKHPGALIDPATGGLVRKVNHLIGDCGKAHCVAFRVCLVAIDTEAEGRRWWADAAPHPSEGYDGGGAGS